MEMQQIRYFLAVCDKASFTRAAQSAFVSQPSLTQSIKKLEEEMGGELFRRGRGGCGLTALGRLLEPSLRRIFHEAQTVKAGAIRFNRLNKVPLRIGVLNTIAAGRLSPFFADFQRERPLVEIELVVDRESTLLEQLEQDGLDLIIGAPTAPLPAHLRSLMLYEERYGVVFNDAHRFNQLAEIDLAAMRSEPYLDRLNCELRETLRSLCLGRQIELYAAYRSNNEEWILSMARAGIGVALMPEFSMPRPAGALKFRYLSDPAISRAVRAIYPAGGVVNPELGALLEMLRLAF